MSGGSVDWPIVIDLTKVLAAPVAAVVIAIGTAQLAIRGFRRQKAVERRVDWYEKMHRQLARTQLVYNALAHMGGRDPDLIGKATHQLQCLIDLMTEAWMFAGEAGFASVQKLGLEIAQARTERAPDSPLTAAFCVEMEKRCVEAAIALSREIRVELLLPSLAEHSKRLPKGI